MNLPKIKWVDVNKLSPSYQEILICINKHSKKDWQIIVGWVEPIDQYTDYKIMAKPNGLGSHYPDVEIPREDILAVGKFNNYGYIVELDEG